MKTVPSFRLPVLAFFLVCLVAVTHAQTQLVFQENTTKTFLYTASNSANTPANYFIKKLAEGSNKNPYRVEYTLNFKQNLRIARAGNQLTLTAEHLDFEPVGDVFYKGFSMQDYLVPGQINFVLNFLSGNNTVLKNFNFNNVNITNYDAQTGQETITDTTNSNSFKLQVGKVSLSYTQNQLTLFDQRIAIINDYYMSDIQLANAMQALQLVNPMDIDNLQFHQNSLVLAENLIMQLNTKKFNETLGLQSFDPIQFNAKLYGLQNEAIAKRNAINYAYATLHETFYNRGLDALVNNQTLNAQKWFNRALEVNPAYAPAMLQLAKIDLANGNLDDAEMRTRDIFIKMNPDPQTKQYAGELAGKIATQYINIGAEQNDKGMHQQALNTLQKASSFCSNIQGLTCPESLYANLGRARKGIYSNMVKDAAAAVSSGNLNQAENKLNEAFSYQKQNAQDIPNTDEANTLLKNIKQTRYANAMTEGKQLLKSKNYEAALSSFDNAANLATTYNLTSDPAMNKLRSEAAKPVLLAKVAKGEGYVQQNKLYEARSLGKEILSQQNMYELNNDKELNTKIDLLRSKINTQECINAQAKFDELYTKAKTARNDKEYIKANDLYTDAEKVLSDFSECNLMAGKIRDEHLEIIPIATYKKLLLQVNTLQDDYQHKEATEKYEAAEKYFYSLEVDKSGLQHLPLNDYAIKYGRNGWLEYLAQHYLDKKELDKSLALCKVLLSRNVSPKRIKYILYDLGKALGTRDKTVTPAGKPKQLVVTYTGNDSKLKMLKKGYLKAW